MLLVIGLYAVEQFARHRHMLRFANTQVLEQVATPRPSLCRQVPTILLAVSVVWLTTLMGGPTYGFR